MIPLFHYVAFATEGYYSIRHNKIASIILNKVKLSNIIGKYDDTEANKKPDGLYHPAFCFV